MSDHDDVRASRSDASSPPAGPGAEDPPTAAEEPLRPIAGHDSLFNAVIESAMDAIIAVDEQQRIVLFNPAAERMFRCSAPEVVGTPVERFVPSEWRVAHRHHVRRFGETGVTSRTMGFGTVSGRRSTGEEFPVEASISKCVVEGRRVFTAILRDVTEGRRNEVEREELVAELGRRNAELERFTYTVSHDLKSPLVTIKGFLGLLERDVAQGNAERIAGDMTRIRGAADTMQQLLEDLLELSRIGRVANAAEIVSLSDLADEALQLVAGRISERGVHVHVPRGLPAVRVDRRRFVEVFQNLFDNAAKYMGDAAQPEVHVSAEADGHSVRCRVSDNGIGIAPAYRDKIFALFAKLDPGTEGTGIGLSIVKRIVETHGGRVWVESPGPGSGSAFVFTVPCVPEGGAE